ncbi:MAG: CHAT domain-containing protein [Chloroflexota bacterium]
MLEPMSVGTGVYAELLIRVTPEFGRQCRVELAFTQPGSTAPTEWSGRAIIDVDAIRAAQNDIDDYARMLSDALFSDEEVRKGFALAEVLAGSQQLRVRLYIDSDQSELHTLRWETLKTPNGTPIATGDRLLFSRYLRSHDWRRVAMVAEHELRALVLIANPSNLSSYGPEGTALEPINVDDELERARRALGTIPMTTYTQPGTATVEQLIDGIRAGHNVIYVVCHGAFVNGQTRLYLDRDSGETASVTGDELARELEQLRQLPALIVLASCQSAGSASSGALAAVGPQLARVGVPSVLAMQERISMRTASAFVETFFTELNRDGRLDRAAAVARTKVKGEPDFWVPVLFSRIQSGCIWPVIADHSMDFERWPALLSYIKKGACTPILGFGLIEFLLGPTREMAKRWADTYHFPMSPHERQDLPQVAQFLAVNQYPGFPADELARYIRGEIIERYGDIAEGHRGASDEDVDEHVRSLVSEVGRRQRANNQYDPYRVLARLPFPIYVTANPDNLLAEALVEAGKQPVIELCRWNDQADLHAPIWDTDPDYKPTPDRPLVYHIFGQLRDRESLVLTEDNFFDFLLQINGNGNGEWKIPPVVTAAWSKNALLFLGFGPDEWTFRVLFRMIISQPGRSLRDRKPHVAVQIDPEEGTSLDPRRAKKYLEQYFTDEQINTYWGSVDRFSRELWTQWQGASETPANSLHAGI